MYHKNAALGDIHKAVNWVVADTAALAALVITVDDLYKFAYQVDNGTVYLLTDHDPAVWQKLGNAGQNAIGLISGGATFSLADNTWTTLAFTAEEIDDDNIADISSNASRLTVPAGYSRARLISSVIFNAYSGATPGARGIRCIKNGNTTSAIDQITSMQAVTSAGVMNTLPIQMISRWFSVIPGDYLETQVIQLSGAAKNATPLFFQIELRSL